MLLHSFNMVPQYKKGKVGGYAGFRLRWWWSKSCKYLTTINSVQAHEVLNTTVPTSQQDIWWYDSSGYGILSRYQWFVLAGRRELRVRIPVKGCSPENIWLMPLQQRRLG